MLLKLKFPIKQQILTKAKRGISNPLWWNTSVELWKSDTSQMFPNHY